MPTYRGCNIQEAVDVDCEDRLLLDAAMDAGAIEGVNVIKRGVWGGVCGASRRVLGQGGRVQARIVLSCVSLQVHW